MLSFYISTQNYALLGQISRNSGTYGSSGQAHVKQHVFPSSSTLLSPVFVEPAKGKNVNSFAGKLVFNIPHTLVIALGKNIWNI